MKELQMLKMSGKQQEETHNKIEGFRGVEEKKVLIKVGEPINILKRLYSDL